jgi:amino acid adenylation domain-containing protein
MNISSERLQKLSTKQRAVYELLLKKKREETVARKQIVRLSREVDSFPLSFAQQRLWLINELHPDSPTYNIPLPVHLHGRLNVQALRRSFSEVVLRHESLRTSFMFRHEELSQSIAPQIGFVLPVVDLTALPEDARPNAAETLVREDYNRPFDLRQPPLFRAVLLVLGPEEHVLTLTMHHIISDDWSIGVLAREVITLYEAFSGGHRSPLPELKIQYVDFAHWQRQWLRGDVLDKHFAYWDEQLGGDLPKLELPTDRIPRAIQTFRGATQPVNLSKALSERLRAIGEGESATLFMTLLAAFQVLLHRYTGQDEIIVGSPIANRNRVEVEAIIGFFVNMLVLRTDLSGNPNFRDLLGRVREMTLGAYAHQDLPFEQMVERVQPQRNLSHSPLFQVAFVLQNGTGQLQASDDSPDSETPKEDGLQWSPYSVSRKTAKFDLTLNLQETADGIRGVLEYSTDLFEASTIERMVGHFQNLLQSIAAQPQQPIWSLPLMDEAERSALLGQTPVGKDDSRADKFVHQLFEAEAEAHPDSVAVVFEKEQLTYAELNRRANQLAHHLRASGVGPETLVGICLEPSLEMIVGILGVIKSGGAYLPLDPAYPVERLAFMLEDARVQIVLTKENLSDAISAHEARLICLDTDRDAIEQASGENPDSEVSAESLAYVIYTSGSTGAPKGVEVVHRNVSSLLAATEDRFNFGASDVWTLFHSYAFDFSVWELWGALAYGGRLVIVPYWVARTPDAMYELVSREGVTVMNQTPSAFKQFVAAEEAMAEAERGTSLRLVIFGGEALDVQSLRGWMGRHGDEKPELVNMYGITETTVHVTYRRVTAEDVKAGGSSPIGSPIDDWELYLLDREMNLVSQGLSGEIYVGGAGVARGYLNRPELTAERFIADEYSGRQGSRLYRTGDLGKRGANGEIEYLGRIDHQVKIRGFRIELSEIEAALSLHPNVREAVVLARADQTGEKRLVAYVVTEDAGDGLESLRIYLKGKLPSYMIPSAFVLMDAMPLTAHGKLDKQALLETDLAEPEPEQLYTPPQTPVEEILAGVWTEVLEIERVGIHDNFFALGGDSIRSIQVRSRAAERGVEFSVQQLFQLQNIHELALAVSFAGAPVVKGLVEPFSLVSESDRHGLPEGLADAYPLAVLQAGMLFHSAFDRSAMLYQNVGSFRLRAPFVESAMQSATQQLINRHGVLRTSFDLNNFSEPLQLVHAAIASPLQVRDIRALPDDEKDRAIDEFVAAERLRHFEWERAPLLRFCIHLLADDTFQFTMTEHHAILDGWSVASLLTELFRVYFSLQDGSEPAPEPPSALTFGDYVALEREALASDDSRRFWKDHLSNSTPIILPRPVSLRREHAAPRIRTLNVPISQEVSDNLKRLALRTAVPLKSVLLAAHLRVLSMYGGKSDVMTGLVSNGRPEEADGERVLGLFLNTLPFRLKLAGGTWEELVRQTFDVERELMPYKRYPMAELQKERSGQQLFEAAFNFTHFHVYESLGEISDVEVLGAISHAATNFTLGTNFSLSIGDNSRLALTLHCDVAAIGDELADALSDSYELVLKSIAGEPRSRYDSISLLSGEQQQKLLVELNDTSRAYTVEHSVSAVEQGIHHLFEAQAAHQPNAIAVVSETQNLTYGELNRKADNLASYLRHLGVGPEVPVGICVEPSTEMLVGLLAILKAGGAYLPLDPAETEEHLSLVIKETGISTVLTQQRLAGNFSNQNVRKICVDEENSGTTHDENRVPAEVDAENLAALVHTSGSTGNPKRVMINHGALINHARSIIDTYELDSTHRVLQFLALNADAAAEEIFPVLASGAAIVLPPHAARMSAPELLDHCRRMSVTTLHLPAAYWYQLEEELERTARRVPEHVKLVIVVGESPSIERMARWAELRQPASRFFNSYGQTETTLTCMAYEASQSPTVAQAKLPIGKLIGNTRAYVLDSFMQPAPTGVAGELHIGGAGLARGYSERPELTAEKFIPNPFSDEAGERLYKTGDLARYMPDGNIDFLGRANRQLDLRGFRIELGEIEDKLLEHPGVRSAFVIALGDEARADEELNETVNLDSLPSSAEALGERSLQTKQLEDAPALHVSPTALERRQIIEGWNRTERDYPLHSTISQLFETQVRATPDSIALSFETALLSYQELDSRANQLAHFLQSRGVGPEVLVALMLDEPVSRIVCLLAVLKAGGAYLPLDTASPPERLRFMIEDAGVGLLLTHQNLREHLAGAGPELNIIYLDEESDRISQHSTAAVESRATADNLAYVIYTSGSTGQPKGTMLHHRGLCNLAFAQIEGLGLHASSRILQFASWGFDASVSETFMTLLAGATLCLVAKERRLPGEELVELLRAEEISVVMFVPSMLAAMPEAELPHLETLFVAGEECPAGLARRWADGRRFYNAYGPTEVTVCATIGEYDGGQEKVSIGRPIGNTQVYVLDEELNVVAVGVTGQLHVGGHGLARGYLKRPELTAEKFIPNHLSGEPGGRLYRTGDLARYREDGQLEFIGRADTQVKLRGYRIELGEIEAVLGRHPAVSEAAVVVREDIGTDKRLVAYLVTRERGREQQESSAVSSAKMREYLKKFLPEYMIPSLFVVLEKMPLTTNDKLDRRALPSPDSRLSQRGGDKRLIAYIEADAAGGQSLEIDGLRSYLKTRLPEYMMPSSFVFLESLPLNAKGGVEISGLPIPARLAQAVDDNFVAPSTSAEEVIAGIWTQLLGIEHVSVHSNFFDLGGHSISATRLVSQMRKAFHVEVPLRAVFETMTIAGQAELAESLVIADIERLSE